MSLVVVHIAYRIVHMHTIHEYIYTYASGYILHLVVPGAKASPSSTQCPYLSNP